MATRTKSRLLLPGERRAYREVLAHATDEEKEKIVLARRQKFEPDGA